MYPGPLSAALIEELSRYVLVEVKPFVLDLARCEGMWLATLDGQRIFDWAGYYASKLLGHNHPGLYEPEYVERLVRAANNKVANPDFLTPECLEYYKAIYRVAPRCMVNDHLEVYAINSGAEAIENMMKYFINLFHQKRGTKPGADQLHRFVYFQQAFHGRTVFALNITETMDPVATKDFHGIVLGNISVPFPAVDSADTPAENHRRTKEALNLVKDYLERYRNEVVGIIVEPIQGAGGHRCAEPEFFQGLSRLAHEYEVSLGFDEVQTAGGQTGAFFMVDQLGLPYPPQAVATAKKFGCGVVYMLYPMEDQGVLDSTWGGCLADMVRFVQELKIVEREGLIEAVAAKEKKLVAGLEHLHEKFPALVQNVRGLGLYQGFSLPSSDARSRLAQMALEEENLLLLTAAPTTIRLRPCLSVTETDIELFLEKMDRCLAKMG